MPAVIAKRVNTVNILHRFWKLTTTAESCEEFVLFTIANVLIYKITFSHAISIKDRQLEQED